jgi:hypothetical protein
MELRPVESIRDEVGEFDLGVRGRGGRYSGQVNIVINVTSAVTLIQMNERIGRQGNRNGRTRKQAELPSEAR